MESNSREKNKQEWLLSQQNEEHNDEVQIKITDVGKAVQIWKVGKATNTYYYRRRGN